MSKSKLKQFEDRIFQDCFKVQPEEAARRITELLEKTEEYELFEQVPSFLRDSMLSNHSQNGPERVNKDISFNLRDLKLF